MGLVSPCRLPELLLLKLLALAGSSLHASLKKKIKKNKYIFIQWAVWWAGSLTWAAVTFTSGKGTRSRGAQSIIHLLKTNSGNRSGDLGFGRCRGAGTGGRPEPEQTIEGSVTPHELAELPGILIKGEILMG